MNKNTLFFFSIFSVVLVVISTSVGLLGGFLGARFFGSNSSEFVQNSARSVNLENVSVLKEESAVIEVANRAKESVVSVVITKDLPIFEDSFDNFWFGFGERRQIGTQERQVGAGTGFIISKEGMIITNRHVVQDESASYTVVFNDGQKFEAKIVARDTLLDIAFLKIETNRELTPLQLGSSEELQVGQTVIAIGNALGEFSNTVSLGIISGLKRNIVASDGMSRGEMLSDVIQTDASINRGNSGGPLLDLRGNVIGVNVAVASQAENIGFAIPVDLVRDLLERLQDDGSIDRPRLGIRYQTITKALAKEEELPFDYGAIVVRGERRNQLAVIPGSPADKIGIQENDIILEIDGKKLTENNPLVNIIQTYRIGDTVKIKFWQKGETLEKSVKLEKF